MDYKKLSDRLEEKVRSLWKNNAFSNDPLLKGDNDVVTETDFAFEEALIETIQDISPETPILSEETHNQTVAEGSYFTIDPIDGTWNFSHGVPIYGTQIALVKDDEPVFGLIYLPVFDYMFIGSKGNGAFLNGKPIKVKDYKKRRTIISVTDLRNVASDLSVQLEFAKLITTNYGRPRMSGCTSFDLAMVAMGAYQGKVNYKYNYWDVLPGILLVREAGGYGVLKKDYALAASSKELADELTATLEEAISFYES